MKSKKHLYRGMFIGLILLIWTMASGSGAVNASILPAPQAVLNRFFEMLVQADLIQVTLYSVFLVFLAIALSLIATTLLILFGRKFEWFGTNVQMMNAVVSPLPGIAILPLVILWFGLGMESMFFILFHATLWPMWTQLDQVVDRIHKRFSRVEQIFKITGFRKFYHIYVLGALHEMRAVLSVSWSRGWRALISAEMIFGMVGNQTGIGWLIYERRMYMDTEGLFAGLLAIALCGILFESFVFRNPDKGQTI